MKICGIDPGCNPAVAILSQPYTDCFVDRVGEGPDGFDEPRLVEILEEHQPSAVVIERVGSFPGQGVSSTFKFGAAWGVIRGICAGLGIPYILVSPVTWKRRVLEAAGYDLHHEETDKKIRKEAQKAVACQFVADVYPSINLIRAGKRVADHNLAEAVALASYGFLPPEAPRGKRSRK
jgi:crossover junction endodeoxyribonuclease RuvC